MAASTAVVTSDVYSVWEKAELVADSGAGGVPHHVVSLFTLIQIDGKRSDGDDVTDLEETRVVDLDALDTTDSPTRTRAASNC